MQEEELRKYIHDCNNYLSVVMGYAQIINKINDVAKTSEYSTKIVDECKKLEDTLKEIRALVVRN